MFEIIPNWHPIFVHFTVGLYSAAAGFYLLAFLTERISLISKLYSSEFEVVARWCLWSVAMITIFTVLAGLQAYNTVNHDGPSHLAMINHRNWALPTAGAIILVAIWSAWRYCRHRAVTFTFILAVLIVQGLLLSTAWRGAELVFRFGLGVISIPKSEGAVRQYQHDKNTSERDMNDSALHPAGDDSHHHGM